MVDCDFLSCSPMVAISNELSFNSSLEYAPNLGHWLSTSNSFQLINQLLIEIIFLQELSKDLSSNPHQLLAKVILIQRIGFSTNIYIYIYIYIYHE